MSLNAAEPKLVQYDNGIAAIYSIVGRIERRRKHVGERLREVEDGLGRLEPQLAIVVDLVSRRQRA